MNEEILNNLNFFSNLTQKTLSAFHLTASDEGIEDAKLLEDLLLKSRKRKLVKVEIISSNLYKRYFSDDFTDIVEFDNLTLPSYITKSTETLKIDKILNKPYSPILTLRLGNDIKTIDFKPIETPIEKLFFI
uniref:Putative RNA-polymerase subunit n=1 Tax=Pichia etchellsii TaxID=28550 RepID=Q9HFH4_PICET|nr:putative RNA-polymerase subunit [Schwanniomyces etchellsii]